MKRSLPVHLTFAQKLILPCAAILCCAACMGEREQLLEEAQNAERPELRAHAIARLAKDPAENDYALFFKATQDPAAVVREAAIEILYLDDGPRIPDLLGSLLDDPVPEIQAYAVKGLIHAPTPKKLAYLRQAYARKGTLTRQLIAEHVDPALLTDFVRHEAELIWREQSDKLTLPAPALQAEAALILGQSGRPEAVERLSALIADPSIYVAAGAAAGLGAAGDAQAIPSLLKLLREPYAEVREPVIAALVALDAAEAIAPLRQIAISKGPATSAALEALGALAGAHPEAGTALCQIAAEASLDVARPVAEALRAARVTCETAAFAARLEQGGEAAISALAILDVLPEPALAEQVAMLLDAPDPRIRDAALLALSQLPDQSALGQRLDALVARALEALEVAKQNWIPISQVRATWPEDTYPEAHGHGHDHGEAERAAPAVTREDLLKANAGISEAQIEAMLQAQEGERQKKQKKQASFEEFLARLDRLAKARAEAIGLSNPPTRVFAYEEDYVPDLTEAAQAHLQTLLAVIARQRTAQLSAEVLEDFWRMPAFRALACEVAGALGHGAPQQSPAPQLAKGVAMSLASDGSAPVAAQQQSSADAPATTAGAALPLAARCLRERDVDVQRAAIRGLLRQGKSAIPLLVETLEMRKEQRAPIIEALVALDAKGPALAPIRAIVQEGGADGLAALQALAAFGDRASVPAIAAKLSDPALRERREVIEVLGHLGDASVRDDLARELFSDQPKIRAAALRALGALKLAGDIPRIAALKSDYYLEVRALAAQVSSK